MNGKAAALLKFSVILTLSQSGGAIISFASPNFFRDYAPASELKNKVNFLLVHKFFFLSMPFEKEIILLIIEGCSILE